MHAYIYQCLRQSSTAKLLSPCQRYFAKAAGLPRHLSHGQTSVPLLFASSNPNVSNTALKAPSLCTSWAQTSSRHCLALEESGLTQRPGGIVGLTLSRTKIHSCPGRETGMLMFKLYKICFEICVQCEKAKLNSAFSFLFIY